MKGIGVGLFIISVLILMGYGIYQLIIDLSIPIFIKISLVTLILGIVMVIGALIIEKIKKRRGKME